MGAAPLVTCVCLTTAPRRAAFLRDALRSFEAQTLPADARELLIVNDGTPLRSTRAGVRVVNLPPRVGGAWSVGEKRNVAVRLACGAWLATWDDDDVSLPDRLTSQLATAERTGAAGVLASGSWVADGELRLAGWREELLRPVQASALLARDAVVRAGGYPACSYREDAGLLTALRLYARAHVVVDRGAWYVLRRWGGGVTLDAGERDDRYLSEARPDPREAWARSDLARVLERRGEGVEGVGDASRA